MSPDGAFAYVANSMAWSAVGAGAVILWYRVKNGVKTPMRIRKPSLINVVAVIVLVVAIVSTIFSWRVDSRQRDFVACQAEVNQIRTEALNELQALGAEDRKVLDKLVGQVLAARTPGSGRQALLDYVATRKRTDEERRSHPLPQPTQICGLPPGK